MSPWEPLHVELGLASDASTVTLFAGEGPFIVNDHLSRAPAQLLASLGWSAAGLWNHKAFPLYGHSLWVLGPEHARTLAAEGWSKRDVKQHLYETIRRPARDLQPDALGAESGRLKDVMGTVGPDTLVPKFPSPAEIRRRRGRGNGRSLLRRHPRVDGRRDRLASRHARHRRRVRRSGSRLRAHPQSVFRNSTSAFF